MTAVIQIADAYLNLTDAQYRQVQLAAKQAGKTVESYCREVLVAEANREMAMRKAGAK